MTAQTLKNANDISDKINFLTVELLKWEKSIGFYDNIKIQTEIGGAAFADPLPIDFTILKDYAITKLKAEISMLNNQFTLL
jgi:hypothetical protein